MTAYSTPPNQRRRGNIKDRQPRHPRLHSCELELFAAGFEFEELRWQITHLETTFVLFARFEGGWDVKERVSDSEINLPHPKPTSMAEAFANAQAVRVGKYRETELWFHPGTPAKTMADVLRYEAECRYRLDEAAMWDKIYTEVIE